MTLPSVRTAHPLWRMTKVVVGLSLMVLGFIGLFLPILQGILFLFLGLAILGTESRRVRTVLEKLKRRHPGPWRKAERLKKQFSQWLGLERRRRPEDDAPSDEGSSREAN